MNLQDSVTFSENKHYITFLDASDKCLKISMIKDREYYYTKSKRPECWTKRGLTKEQTVKLIPLMYVGSYFLKYPEYPFTNKYKISFTGSKTSMDRLQATFTLMDKYGKDFIGGFRLLKGRKWTRELPLYDEDGFDFSKVPVPEKYRSDYVQKEEYLSLMRDSTISFSPSGFGRNTHRFVDILCMGGAGLVADVSHIDYGPLGPNEHEHFLSYKKDRSDLLEKAEYLLSHKKKAEDMGNRAKDWMRETYIDNGRMAKAYILEALK